MIEVVDVSLCAMRLYALKVPASLPEETFDQLLRHLPEHAQVRVRKFHHEADAIRSLTARLLPTWYLRQSGILPAPEHPKYEIGRRGKPYLPGLGVQFNTTHEGHYVLIAAGEGEVGVDVMDLPSNPDELAESIDFQLTEEERAIVKKASGRVKAKLLTTLWTVKEGYTKAIGEGVGFGLDRIAVDLGDGSVRGIRVDGRDIREDGWSWVVGSLEGGEYGYAVIWRGGGEVTVVNIDWRSFVRAFIGNGAVV